MVIQIQTDLIVLKDLQFCIRHEMVIVHQEILSWRTVHISVGGQNVSRTNQQSKTCISIRTVRCILSLSLTLKQRRDVLMSDMKKEKRRQQSPQNQSSVVSQTTLSHLSDQEQQSPKRKDHSTSANVWVRRRRRLTFASLIYSYSFEPLLCTFTLRFTALILIGFQVMLLKQHATCTDF